jgi:uncharacterized protein YjiK
VSVFFTVTGSAAPDSAQVTTASFTSTLLNTVDMAAYSAPVQDSPDPSGITYLPAPVDRLMVTDGDVDETVDGITHFAGANLWELNRDGSPVRTANISSVDPTDVPMTDEPSGVAFNRSTGHYFVTDDSQRRVLDLNPGADGLMGTAGDTWTLFSTIANGNDNTDPEGIAYDSWNARLFVADGGAREIYQYTTAGALAGHFDVQAYGVEDPETVEFNPISGTLFVLSNSQSGPIVAEVTTGGALVQTLDLSASNAIKPAGLAYAPASNGPPGAQSFYIVDRGVANTSNPNIVDGKIYEMSAPPPSTPANAPPSVSAGPDLAVTLPSAASLHGTVTDDGTPNPVTSVWSQVSGPSTVTFGDASAAHTTATVSIPGAYVVRLTATDGEFTIFDEATLTVTGTGSVQFLDVRVSASLDDAEQLDTNGMRLANADLDMLIDDAANNVAVGLRFTGLGIPQGASVTNAYVQFEADEPHSDLTLLTIKGQDADNALTFASTSSNITSRPMTTASGNWSPDPWQIVGETTFNQRTPNLSGIVQEIVSRPGWTGSSALVLVITGSGRRVAEAWDSNPDAAPLLHVEWTTADNQPPSVGAGPDQTITLPAGATLDGTVSDDGLPAPPSLTTTWSQTSGPGTASFANANAVDTDVTFSQDGTYVLRLTADDGALASSDELTVTVNQATLYFSVATAATLTGVSVVPQDIVAFDGLSYSLLLDGSDVGLDSSGEAIDAFARLADGRLLVSTTGSFSVPGLSGNDEDVIALTSFVLGATSAGTWAMYFDGGNFGLTSSGEDVDAVELLADGRLLVSTGGLVSVTGVSGEDEDVLAFTPGPNTWAMYFDGTDVGLTNSGEDVDGVALDGSGKIYLSTTGNFSVTGRSGADEDVFVFTPSTLGPNTAGTFSPTLFFDGSAFGLAANDLFAIELP